jgi:hypothetical protein
MGRMDSDPVDRCLIRGSTRSGADLDLSDGGVSTATAARNAGRKGERVPRTGSRFVRHLNRLSALAFLRPVRKVFLGPSFRPLSRADPSSRASQSAAPCGAS